MDANIHPTEENVEAKEIHTVAETNGRHQDKMYKQET